MASYTDNPNLLASFSPYVQQLPVDAMVKVGVQKQEQYNQGIQRIQAQIDNIAGLPVTKEIHKEYLQSKLNELGGKLKTVAAGDFSNFQLQNSVMGMTNQIVKDPIVQNAVYSTEMIRKGQNELDAARQSGKSSPQNEAFWNKQISDWENDGNLTSQFSGNYISYTDVNKKLTEVADKIHEIDSSIDDPFQRNPDGSYRTDANGKPIVDAAMLTTKTKGKPAEKILAAFMDSLDENDQRQLHIDSWYHYRGATKDTFKNDIIGTYNSKKDFLTNSKTDIALELKTNTKLTTAEKDKYEAQINNINQMLQGGELEKERDNQLSGIDTADLEQLKYKLYTGNYLQNLAKDLSYQSYSQEIKNNPYKQMDMETKRLQLAYDSERFRENMEMKRYNLDVLKTQFSMQQATEKNRADKFGPITSEALPVNEKQLTLQNTDIEIQGIKDNINSLNSQYAPYMKGDTPDAKQRYMDGMLSAYKTDPSFVNSLSPQERDYLERRRAQDVILTKKIQLKNAAAEVGNKIISQINTILDQERPSITSSGNRINARDIYDVYNEFSNTFNKPEGTETAYLKGKAGIVSGYDYSRFLDRYAGTDKEDVARAFVKQATAQPLTQNDRTLIQRATELNGKYNETSAKLYADKLKAENEYLVQHTPIKQVQSASVTVTNPQMKSTVIGFVGQKLQQYHLNNAEKGFKWDNFDPETASRFISNQNSSGKQALTLYSIERDPDTGEGKLVMMNSGKRQEIPIKEEEMRTYFPEVTQTNPFNDAIEMANFSPNKSTNLNINGTGSDAVNAYVTGYSGFTPNLNNTDYAGTTRFDIEAYPFNMGAKTDKFLLRGYTYRNGQWITGYMSRDYSSIEGIREMLSKLGPRTMNDFYNKYKK